MSGDANIAAVSPLLLERYEMKYLIPVKMVDEISRYVEGHCQMDYYSKIEPEHYYTINSLYFDSPTFTLLHRKEAGLDPSFSLRVRSYGMTPQAPFFAELKYRRNGLSNKMRSKIHSPDWAEVLLTAQPPEGMDDRSKEFLAQFAYLMTRFCAQPKILTQYQRKAYISEVDRYARVTFDRNLRFQPEEEFNVCPDPGLMSNYDIEEIYPHPEEAVILELKCEKRVPLWMVGLIKKFDLTRRGFSKYRSSVFQSMGPLVAPNDLQPKERFQSFNGVPR